MVGNITIPSTRYPPYGIELSSLQRKIVIANRKGNKLTHLKTTSYIFVEMMMDNYIWHKKFLSKHKM